MIHRGACAAVRYCSVLSATGKKINWRLADRKFFVIHVSTNQVSWHVQKSSGEVGVWQLDLRKSFP
jgi:hypothetical protein